MSIGRRAKDMISGFEGYCTARTTYLSGCDQICIEGASKDGKPGERAWFDVTRIEWLDGSISLERGEKPGGGEPPVARPNPS